MAARLLNDADATEPERENLGDEVVVSLRVLPHDFGAEKLAALSRQKLVEPFAIKNPPPIV